jgi:hypothetical protein
MKKLSFKKPTIKKRDLASMMLAIRTGNYAGNHHNREYDVRAGRKRHPKHKGKNFEE